MIDVFECMSNVCGIYKLALKIEFVTVIAVAMWLDLSVDYKYETARHDNNPDIMSIRILDPAFFSLHPFEA